MSASSGNAGISQTDIEKYKWMVRSEREYDGECVACLSIRGRLNQYYYNGGIDNCSEQWMVHFSNKRDLNDRNLNLDEKHEIERKLIEFELERRKTRAENSLANNVWEYRQTPPKDWDEPLPEFMEAKKDSPLDELQNSWKNNDFSYSSSWARCVLM